MKNTVKSVVVLMAILMVSSVVMANPGGRSAKSSTTQTNGAIWGSDGAIWGGSGCRVQGCLNQAVKTTQTPVHTRERNQPNEHGLFHGIWQSIETAIWGFVPPPTR